MSDDIDKALREQISRPLQPPASSLAEAVAQHYGRGETRSDDEGAEPRHTSFDGGVRQDSPPPLPSFSEVMAQEFMRRRARRVTTRPFGDGWAA